MAAPRANNPQLGILLMVSAIVALAAMEAVAKQLTKDYPFLFVAWARYAFHMLAILPFFVSAKGIRFLGTGRPWLHGLRTMILATATLFFFGALGEMPLADATALVFTTPLIVTAVSAAFLGETVGWKRWAAVLVGFGGVLVIVRPSPDFTNWIALLPLATGFCYAAYQLSTRILSATDHVMTLFFYGALGGALVLSCIVPFYWAYPTLADWGLLALMGAFGAIGQYFVIRSLQIAEASIVSPFIYTQLIWATIFGLILFDQFPDQWVLIGAAIVVASGLYIWHRERGLAKAAVQARAAGGP
jgi:drug/metabolite transporter (DMT)-like permease